MASGKVVMVMGEVAETLAHGAVPVTKLVTVYTPGVEAPIFTKPEPPVILNPTVELKAPKLAPTPNVGLGLPEVVQ